MPVQPTKKQEEIFEKLSKELIAKGYKNLGYIENADSHKFGTAERICCYLQYISSSAYIHPPESLMVVVYQNKQNENGKDFEVGNYLYGQVSMHVFVIPNNQESYNKALKLIDTVD